MKAWNKKKGNEREGTELGSKENQMKTEGMDEMEKTRSLQEGGRVREDTKIKRTEEHRDKTRSERQEQKTGKGKKKKRQENKAQKNAPEKKNINSWINVTRKKYKGNF